MARVLIVEDDRPLRTALMIVLKKDGWEAHGTDSVEEAMGLLRQGPFHLVVTDYLLASDLDGLSLLEYLQGTGGPPAILISGSRHQELGTLARQYGAFAFLQKPFDLQAFVELCRLFLRCGTGRSNKCKRAPRGTCLTDSECLPASDCCYCEPPGQCPEPYDMCRLFPE